MPKTERALSQQSAAWPFAKFITTFDADHRNSLFARQVSAITFFAQGWDYLSPSIFREKCYAYHHDEDMRSTLYLRTAANSDLCGR
jgi:hypothetical protein